jgi:hypothetical protein
MEEDAATVMEKWKVLMAGTPVTFDMRNVSLWTVNYTLLTIVQVEEQYANRSMGSSCLYANLRRRWQHR